MTNLHVANVDAFSCSFILFTLLRLKYFFCICLFSDPIHVLDFFFFFNLILCLYILLPPCILYIFLLSRIFSFESQINSYYITASFKTNSNGIVHIFQFYNLLV